LDGKQCTPFCDKQKFMQMIKDINNKHMSPPLLSISNTQIDSIAKEGYEVLNAQLHNVLKALKSIRVFSERFIHPNTIGTINRNTVYVSAPMASVNDIEYKEIRDNILLLDDVLKNIGFQQIFCPLFEKETHPTFDGKTKAVKDNFAILKQVDSMIIIYPSKIPSSVLIELGYGIALCKRLVVFYNEGLPYMLEEAGGTI